MTSNKLLQLVPKSMTLRGVYATSGTFVPSIFGSGPNSTCYSISIQSDGKSIVVGGFTTWNKTTVGRIVRLKVDGSIDTDFISANGTGANNLIRTVNLQSDGKIIVSGNFTSWNGTTTGRIVRLNSDGSLDSNFTTSNGTGANGIIYDTAIQSDGKIIIVGNFTSWNGTSAIRMTRLNSDGTLDSSFNSAMGAGADATVQSVSIHMDGIVAVGSMTTWDNISVGRIIRLRSNGTLDTSFLSANGSGATGTSYFLYGVGVQPTDGKIIIVGQFSSWDGTTVGNVARLSYTGTLDSSFVSSTGTGSDTGLQGSYVQSDGKILLFGQMTSWNGTAAGAIVRLNSDGTADSSFNSSTGSGANSDILGVDIQSDGKILLAGVFSQWNGLRIPNFMRISSSGSQVGAYEIPDTVFAVLVGGGGGGCRASTGPGGGGGAGAIAYGIVPSSNFLVIGAGGSGSNQNGGGTGGVSRFSTLIAYGGGGGGPANAATAALSAGTSGSYGSGGGGAGCNSVAGNSSLGSKLFYSLGGAGSASTYSASASVSSTNGETAISGGGGGASKTVTGASLNSTGGSGGNGFVGGGGGGASGTGVFTAGNGGSSLSYSGGIGSSVSGSAGGGAGILSSGADAGNIANSIGGGYAGAGGAGGGGGGGGGMGGYSQNGGTGGVGALLLYW